VTGVKRPTRHNTSRVMGEVNPKYFTLVYHHTVVHMLNAE